MCTHLCRFSRHTYATLSLASLCVLPFSPLPMVNHLLPITLNCLNLFTHASYLIPFNFLLLFGGHLCRTRRSVIAATAPVLSLQVRQFGGASRASRRVELHKIANSAAAPVFPARHFGGNLRQKRQFRHIETICPYSTKSELMTSHARTIGLKWTEVMSLEIRSDIDAATPFPGNP